MKTKIGISLDWDSLKKIDEARGLIPRSTYINELIKGFTPAQTAKTATGASQNNTANGDDSGI